MKLKVYQKLMLALITVISFLPLISMALCDMGWGSGGGP